MRCTTQPRDCPTGETCELQGCREPYWKPGTAVARERDPIPLDYQPGRATRGLMSLADRAAAFVKRGPTPFAPALPAPEPPAMDTPAPTPPQPPPAPATPLVGGLRIIEAPGPAWLVYLDGKLIGLTQRIEQLAPL